MRLRSWCSHGREVMKRALAILLGGSVIGIAVGMSRRRIYRLFSSLRPKAGQMVKEQEDYGTIVAPTG